MDELPSLRDWQWADKVEIPVIWCFAEVPYAVEKGSHICCSGVHLYQGIVNT